MNDIDAAAERILAKPTEYNSPAEMVRDWMILGDAYLVLRDRDRRESEELVTEEHCRKWKLPQQSNTSYLLVPFHLVVELELRIIGSVYFGHTMLIRKPVVAQVRHLAAAFEQELLG